MLKDRAKRYLYIAYHTKFELEMLSGMTMPVYVCRHAVKKDFLSLVDGATDDFRQRHVLRLC